MAPVTPTPPVQTEDKGVLHNQCIADFRLANSRLSKSLGWYKKNLLGEPTKKKKK